MARSLAERTAGVGMNFDTPRRLGRSGGQQSLPEVHFVRSRSLVATCVVAALAGAGALVTGPAQAANDQRTPGSGAPVVIGMVDTGVNATHQEFSYNPSIAGPNGQFVAWWDFSADADSHLPGAGQVWDTAEPNPYDPNGHGTITASMAAGRNVTPGKTKSFAPGYNLSVAKVGDAAGSISGDLAAAIRWQVDDAKADIVSMSIGEIAPLPAVISEPVF